MNELVKIDQNVTIVPRNFNYTNKGMVTEVSPKGFRMKMKYPTTGLKEKVYCEFYSQTPNDNPHCQSEHHYHHARFHTMKYRARQVLLKKII